MAPSRQESPVGDGDRRGSRPEERHERIGNVALGTYPSTAARAPTNAQSRRNCHRDASAAKSRYGAAGAYGGMCGDQEGAADVSGTGQPWWIRWRARSAGGRWLAAVMIAVFGATVLVASVAAASAATPGGVLYAFGNNDSGQLGSASSIGNPNPTPVALPAGVGAVTEIAAGESAAGGGYSLVLTATGQLYGFGNNDSGELGSPSNNGTFNANPTPTLVGLPGQDGAVTQIAAGFDHSLVVTSSGQLYAFGYNGAGDLGNTTNDGADVANPTPTLVSLPGQVGPVTHVAAGGFQSLVITASGQLYAFGQNAYGELGLAANSGSYVANPTPTLVTLPGATGTVAQIATGFSHSLALTSTGQLYAFGDNQYGQLGNDTGNGTTTANPTPTQVTLPGQNGAITQIAAGDEHSLAVTASGQLYAFGDNDDGELGTDTDDGSDAANPTPTLVSFPTGMTVDSVAEGPTARHVLAIVSAPATVPAPAPAPAPIPAPTPPTAPQTPVISPPPPKGSTPAAAARAPTVSRIAQSHSHWRAGKRAATTTDGRRLPVGTTFALTLDRPARVSFSFAQLLAGRRVKGRCTPQTRQSRHGSVCTRAVTQGTLSFSGRRGRNTVFFSGRISSAKTLRPGRYTVIISAANSVGRSESHSLGFTIVPERRRTAHRGGCCLLGGKR